MKSHIVLNVFFTNKVCYYAVFDGLVLVRQYVFWNNFEVSILHLTPLVVKGPVDVSKGLEANVCGETLHSFTPCR